ncbi:MAG: hypothetical protein E6I57_11940 [Chloroflexi bacterium]|nr:MAG: hypothetical protein E6J49_04925 [Chloroflexota bacterium]TMB93182.1 MAG: hypothetical protein E6J38_11390 [Chloroflexota bacterium]TMC28386.1 MAG: hypothetical protein E6J27_08755 [Chloroflexota bacterium]TMC34462.1 MAG: hypothetical protein E6J24_06355 [Chloroflexota bacterium]TMC59119.1 MAG: hypothetical protein E6J19_00695 [Chloroflexota bacterium]
MSAYPLTLRFRILALGQTIEGTDASGAPVCFVKQKAFRLREDVAVFRDPSQSEQIYRMRADRIIDIGARYDITDPSGMPVGAVKQRGMRTLWRATYDILDTTGTAIGLIHEENPWVKVLDAVIGEIPFVGIVLQMFVNPAYVVEVPVGTRALYIRKRRSLVERRFIVEQLGPIPPALERVAVPALLMMVLLERGRG